MSWAGCGSGSNNVHFDRPPLMNDGRNYASWYPGAHREATIRHRAGITSNWDYRQYLTKNADAIIRANQKEACGQCCDCPSYAKPEHQAKLGKLMDVDTPFLYKNCQSKARPAGYEDSDLKDMYLSSYQLQCRMRTPVITQEQLLARGFPNPN